MRVTTPDTSRRVKPERQQKELNTVMPQNQAAKPHDQCTIEAAKWAATMTFHSAGFFTPEQRTAAGIDVAKITASCVKEANGDVGKAAGLAVSAAWRIIVNIVAQETGVADTLGVAPDRAQEAAGRYDGTV